MRYHNSISFKRCEGTIKETEILIAEDDAISAQWMKDILTSQGYSVDHAPDGQKALEMYSANRYLVVITDIEMPVMGGEELIDHLVGTGDDPVIIVETVHQEVSLIIDIMKKGVYDYIVKPLDPQDISIKINRAFETAKLRKMKYITEREKVIRLENQLEWYRWKERYDKRSHGQYDKNIFKNLVTNFSQGSGIGTLVTLFNLLLATSEKKGDQCVFDAQIMDLLHQNIKIAEKVLDTFSYMNSIISGDIHMEQISCGELYNLVAGVIAELESLAEIKQQKFLLSDPKSIYSHMFLSVNKDCMYRALHELLINACKFSEKGSNIFVLMDAQESEFMVSIISRPQADENGRVGIPPEYENIIFEPFCRMTKSVYEEYRTLDFGLGLSAVEKIIQKHGGRVYVNNIINHSDITRDPVLNVNFTFILPVGS